MQYYKVKNTTGKPIYKSWTEDLLPEDKYQEFQEYKKSPGYLGSTPEEKHAMKGIPASVRLRSWANTQMLGKAIATRHALAPAGEVEYKFELPEGVTVLTERQAKGLMRFQIKEIKQKLEPGQLKPQIHKEGFLEIAPIDEVEAEKLLKAVKEQLEIYKPISQCNQCKGEFYNRQLALIVERVNGKITGKQLKLCPACRMGFFDMDIKRNEIMDRDTKFNASKWNKEE